MSSYTFAFALTTALGNRARLENLRKYADRDASVECVWVPINHYLEPDPYARWPEPIHSQRVLNHEGQSLFKRWDSIDAAVVHAFQFFSYLSLYRAVRRHRPLLALAQDYAPFSDASMLRAYGQDVDDSLRRRMRVAAERWFTRRADIYLPMSSWVEQSLIDCSNVPPEQIHVIPPGIDLELWTYSEPPPSTDRPVRVLFVGGDFIRKGGDLLSEAVSRIERDIELHVVTRETPELIPPNAIVHSGIGPNDERLRQLYATADIFALPTRADMFSIAALEAMATGRPVIATRMGGIPDIVRSGSTGFLIDVNSLDELQQALVRLVDDPSLRRRMGEQGRRVVEQRFSASATAARTLAVLKARIDRERERAVNGAPG